MSEGHCLSLGDLCYCSAVHHTRLFSFQTMDLLRAWVLCTALLGLTEAFTHQDMKDALLQKLGLDEVPKIHKRDLENLVIPAHVRNKYLSMLKMHHSRRRRSLPSLAGILRGIPGNAGKHLYNISCVVNKSSTTVTVGLNSYFPPPDFIQVSLLQRNSR